MTMNKGLSVAVAAIGGALVGGAVALLFAPQKGSRTRRDITRFVKDNCPFIKDSKQIEEIADRIEDAIEDAVENVKG